MNIGELMKGAQCQFSLDESEPIFNIGGLMKGRTGAQCQFFGLVGDDEFGYTKTKLLNEKKKLQRKNYSIYIDSFLVWICTQIHRPPRPKNLKINSQKVLYILTSIP